MLLNAGEDPSRYNPVGCHAHSTPLHQAALAGHIGVVRLLVQRGASRAGAVLYLKYERRRYYVSQFLIQDTRRGAAGLARLGHGHTSADTKAELLATGNGGRSGQLRHSARRLVRQSSCGGSAAVSRPLHTTRRRSSTVTTTTRCSTAVSLPVTTPVLAKRSTVENGSTSAPLSHRRRGPTMGGSLC